MKQESQQIEFDRIQKKVLASRGKKYHGELYLATPHHTILEVCTIGSRLELELDTFPHLKRRIKNN